MTSIEREARLKPEFADQYPTIPAGRWVSASEVGARLLMYIARGGMVPEGDGRLLRGDHFEFRGAEQRGTRILRTRLEDPERPGDGGVRTSAH
jgi:hypothetical protein